VTGGKTETVSLLERMVESDASFPFKEVTQTSGSGIFKEWIRPDMVVPAMISNSKFGL